MPVPLNQLRLMKYKAFKHQQKSLAHADTTPVVFDCSDPGTGKTAVRIWAFEKRRKKKSGCALVLAPKSLLRSVWANDVRRFAPGLKVSVSVAGKHEAAFAAEADMYITNHDAVKWLAKQKPAFFKKFDEFIVDESPAYKHHSRQRSRAMLKISKYFKYRTCMTGTPNSNSITDIWHQVAILDDGKRLGPSFFKFRNSVCVPIQQGRNKDAVRWEDKEGSEEAVFGLLGDIVIRHKFEDCVDIPPNHKYTLPFEMSPKHRKAYDELLTHSMLQVKKGLVTAVHAGALANKLLQVASGAVYESPDKYHLMDTGRYEMVLDLVEEREHSLVIYLWKHQRDMLVAEADKRGLTFALIDGDTPLDERTAIEARYQRGEYRVLFGHPQTIAHGYTFTKGTTTIWPSPTYNLEHFSQGSRRQYRIGQTKKTETIVLIAEGTAEQDVWDKLLCKEQRMDNLLVH